MHFVSYNEFNPHKYCGNMFSNDKYGNKLLIAFTAAYLSDLCFPSFHLIS